MATPNADVRKHYRKRSFNVQLNALDSVKALLQTQLLKQAFCTYISLCTNAPLFPIFSEKRGTSIDRLYIHLCIFVTPQCTFLILCIVLKSPLV